MKRRFFASLAAAAAVTASMVMVSGADAATPDATAAGVQSAGVTSNANLDPVIRVDETQFKIVASVRGVGEQIYDCSGTGLTFREPATGLFTSRRVPAAIHGRGPFWTNFDGSRVDGSAPTPPSTVTPDPKSVPWLKLIGTPTPNTTRGLRQRRLHPAHRHTRWRHARGTVHRAEDGGR